MHGCRSSLSDYEAFEQVLIEAQERLRMRVVLCVSRKHPLAQKRRLSWDDLRNFGFVIRKPRRDMGISARFIEVMRKKGFTPKVVMQCDSVEAKRAAVKNQLGIGICFKPTIEDDLKNGELVELDVPEGRLNVKSYIIYRKTRAPSAAAQDFIQVLRDHRDKLHKQFKNSKHPIILPRAVSS